MADQPDAEAPAPAVIDAALQPPSEAAQPTLEDRVRLAVRTWQTTCLSNSPVSRSPECWAHVANVLEQLTTAILNEV
jgi:hypothetical protein